jgi:two-component system chemotaxis sensor kinase CheA
LSVPARRPLVPILNIPDLLLSARLAPVASRLVVRDGQEGARPESILVAEDSITTRTLLANILQSSGYRVSTAVDGLDAFRALKEGEFDLLVSDIEMPRLNGFDLTSKIRADENLANLPIVLVTSLASSEDREKGIEAGADAYVVKSAFDQRNLVQIIQGLV